MKAVIAAVVLALAMLCTPVAFAWNCSNPLAERVLVPSTTTGSYGDGDGQLASYGGQLYECEVVAPSTPSTGSQSNSTSASNSNSSSQSNSNSSSTSKATGGNSNATGGNATATGGAGGQGGAGGSVSGSGNSTNTIHNTNLNVAQGGTGGNANQKQGQTQSQTANGGNAVSTASGDGVGNGNNSNDTAINYPHQTATAYAPEVLPTVPCFKGFSGGIQGATFGASFGGGKVDQNCQELEAARQAPSRLARCKVYITNKYVQKAGVTLEDCLNQEIPTAPVVRVPNSIPSVVVNIPAPVVNVPAPVINVIAATPAPSVIVRAAPAKPRVPRSANKCVPRECPKAKLSSKVWTDEDVERLNPAKQ